MSETPHRRRPSPLRHRPQQPGQTPGAKIERKVCGIAMDAADKHPVDSLLTNVGQHGETRLVVVSAHLDADIMLVDEVLAVGDTAFQTKCLGKLRSLADEGRTVMFVSHHLHLVADLCDRVIWLDGGRKVTDGDTAPTLDDYGRSQDAVAATNLAWVRSSLPRAVTVGSNGGDTTASTANDTTGNDTTANAANDTTDNDTVGRAVLDQGEPVVIRCVVETLQPPADALLELSIRRDGLVVTAAALKPPPEGRTRSP